MSAATATRRDPFPPLSLTRPGRDVPLSRWLADQAAWYLGQGHERGLFVARVLSDLAAQVRAVESPDAPPITVEQALDRLEALDQGDGWPEFPSFRCDLIRFGV